MSNVRIPTCMHVGSAAAQYCVDSSTVRYDGGKCGYLHLRNPPKCNNTHVQHSRCKGCISIVVSIPACHAGDRGSIPRCADDIIYLFFFFHPTQDLMMN